jgi:hypothetical protein
MNPPNSPRIARTGSRHEPAKPATVFRVGNAKGPQRGQRAHDREGIRKDSKGSWKGRPNRLQVSNLSIIIKTNPLFSPILVHPLFS